jgi:hypothetical protein
MAHVAMNEKLRHPPLHAEDPMYVAAWQEPVGGPLEAGHDDECLN